MVFQGLTNDQTIDVSVDLMEYKLLCEILRLVNNDAPTISKAAAVLHSQGISIGRDDAAALLKSMQLIIAATADLIMGDHKPSRTGAFVPGATPLN